MRNLNAILLLFAGVLCLSACEAKCRRKNAAKLKRSLKIAISSDKINNRHNAGLRKIFRRKRNSKEEEETMESDKFTAEIKFLQKWNPAMNKKDGSVYRLFQGNVLDAILEQMNADRRFMNSHVLDLKKTSDGILAQVGFHFRKSEHNPISHIRFIVSQGHLSSLKVDKHYFKILNTHPKFSNDHDNSKTSTQQQHTTTTNGRKMLQKNPSGSAVKQENQENPATIPNESPTASASSQTQPQRTNTYQTLNQASTENLNQPQGGAKPQVVTPNQASTQDSTTAQANAQPEKPKSQGQNLNTAQVLTNQEETQEAGQIQSQNFAQGQGNAQVTDNKYSSNQPQAQYQNEARAQQQTNIQEQNVAVYQQEQQTNTQSALSQTISNPSTNPNGNGPPNGAQIQNKDQLNAGEQSQQTPENLKPAENALPKASSIQNIQKNQESAHLTSNADEEIISIKMNQAWFPFLSNHESPQYKMLTGNLEKGLKSVMGNDKNIKDIKVKNLLRADEGHTTVEFLVQFNGGKKYLIETLRSIVKTGDIAGISVDANFFKTEDEKKTVARNPQN